MPSYDTTYTGQRVPFNRKQPVFVIVRHTRSGDKRIAVSDDDGSPEARNRAMEIAEDVADEAARNYGEGRSSVYKGVLTTSGKALTPEGK